MKKSIFLPLAAGFCVFVASCSSATDKTEPAKSEPAPAEPAAAAPPPVEPAPVPEPPKPAEPSKTEASKAAPADPAKPAAAKSADAKNEPKAAAPKPKETTLDSGLKIIDTKEGQGDAVKPGNTIAVHYTGWLYENGKRGTKFDSSVDRGP